MLNLRQCSRSACSQVAVATLTYVYSDSTAVLGPLADVHEPHHYDLCAPHAARLTAPRGWTVVRVAPSEQDFAGKVDQQEADRLELAQRTIELSKPLHSPNDDWAVLAEAIAEQSTGTPERIQSVSSPFDTVTSAPQGAKSQVPTHFLHDAEVDADQGTKRGHLRVLRGEG